jgi:hypothetical protein
MMNADPVTAARGLRPAPASAQGLAEALGFRAFVVVACLFWAYSTLSAVLYAWGLGTSIEADLGESPFASAPVRIVQYLALLPLVLAAWWASLRIGWQSYPRLAGQLLMAIGFALVAYPLLGVGIMLVGEEHTGEPGPWTLQKYLASGTLTTWLSSFTDFLIRYGFGLALVTGVAVYKQLRDSEVRRTELERQWTSARLAALRMQLSPHTLFNLLHAIRGQVAWNPAAAQALIVQFADLLRRLLRAGERDFVTLTDELSFVRLYLDLQAARFEDRLVVTMPDPAATPAVWVPSLILQPLVENAVVHGLAGHAGPVTLTVTVLDDADLVRLQVRNTVGAASGGDPPREDHLGLRNVRERLAVQFGERASLASGPAADGGWLAEVRLPRVVSGPDGG